MGWFSKKEERGKEQTNKFQELPSLPELHELPELPDINENEEESSEIPIRHQLPSFPSSSIGEKFSRKSIKDAVTGRKESDRVFGADGFTTEERGLGMMRKPRSREIISPEREEKVPEEFKEAARIVKKTEPVFIRIDKFEDSLHLFEKIKKQISEIEHMLVDVKSLKNKEEVELISWENEIQSMKGIVEKIDQDIFSKIE